MPGSHRLAPAMMKMMKDLEQWTTLMVDVIARATSQLPPDVTAAIRRGRTQEAEGSLAAMALDSVLKNADIASAEKAPMCQDTGVPVSYTHLTLPTKRIV